MSEQAYIGLAGVLVGSIVSLIGVVITQRFTENREIRKEKSIRQEEAIAEVYSPIMFHLEKTRDIFSSILAIKEAGSKPELWTEGQMGVLTVQAYASKKAAIQRDVLMKMLMEKAGLMNPNFYFDLTLFESYLDTSCQFLDQLVINCLQEPEKVKKVIQVFVPMISEFDDAISNMRVYAGKMVTRQKVEYQIFFDENKRAKIENYVDSINIKLMGVKVPDWDSLMKKEPMKR